MPVRLRSEAISGLSLSRRHAMCSSTGCAVASFNGRMVTPLNQVQRTNLRLNRLSPPQQLEARNATQRFLGDVLQ